MGCGLHCFYTSCDQIAVKVFNIHEVESVNQQIRAACSGSDAFICGIDYQLIALTNSYKRAVLLFHSMCFYYISSK